MPEDLYYTEDHAWLKVEDNGLIRIGINDFAQKMAGKISYVKVPKTGKKLEMGKVFFSLQSGKWAGKVMVPFAGVVEAANKELLHDPELINKDCYGKGWVALIKVCDAEASLSGMMKGSQTVQWLEKEILRAEEEKNKKG